MAGSVNKVLLVGNLGRDPEIKSMHSGDRVANLSIATSESWKNKNTGERQERTEWHRVVVFNQGLIGIIEKYLKKGTKVYIEGQLETRSWEQNGEKKYTTEVVLRPFKSELNILDSRGGESNQGGYDRAQQTADTHGGGYTPAPVDELEDEIPF